MASDTRHDPSTINQALVTWANIDYRLDEMTCISAQRSQPFHNTFASPPIPPSFSNTPSTPFPPKRFSPYDQSGRPSRLAKSSLKCFRCGAVCHTSAVCDSKSPSAGRPFSPWTKQPGARSEFLIDGTAGRLFCLGWAQSPSCRFADRRRYSHRRFICGEGQHGTNACSK